MESSAPLTTVGVVAIGRNEGERLEACLKSVIGKVGVVVYVDSGSTDGSMDLAETLGVTTLALDLSRRFTAARARNAGAFSLLQAYPHLEFLQFVDGDCTVDASWISKGVDFLQKNPQYVVTTGRRREIFRDKNAYHRIADMEWDTPVGEAKYCGGDALVRAETFRASGGFRDSLIAGEEPELCVRLRHQGGKIFRLDAEMTSHDIRMNSIRQAWKRSERAGHAFAEGARLHGAPPERHWVKERRSIFLWGLLFPAIALATAWVTAGLSVAALLLAYSLLTVKTAIQARQNRKWPMSDCVLFALNCVAVKLPQAWGLLNYEFRRITGHESKLIEYNQAPNKLTESSIAN